MHRTDKVKKVTFDAHTQPPMRMDNDDDNDDDGNERQRRDLPTARIL